MITKENEVTDAQNKELMQQPGICRGDAFSKGGSVNGTDLLIGNVQAEQREGPRTTCFLTHSHVENVLPRLRILQPRGKLTQ